MGHWRPTIGDPGFMGWFTVASYFACAILCFFPAFSSQTADRKFLLFWRLISLLMILLGINKQLDLQSLFTEVGRQIARAQGWMDHRRVVQFWFILVLWITTIGIFLFFVTLKWNLFRQFTLAYVGLFFLLCFIVTRAASFHHFDQFLGFELFGARMNWVLELTGIYVIGLGAFREIILLRAIRRK